MFASSTPPLPLALMPHVREAAREAGAIAMPHFREGEQTAARLWFKEGKSPVTEADIAVDTFLKEKLLTLHEAGWLSEETADDPSRLDQRFVWVVDPIDGTRAFAAGSPDWCVAIALLEENRPILGVVYSPIGDLFYEAIANGGAFLNGERLHVPSTARNKPMRVAGPKPMADLYASRTGSAELLPKIPSLALRIVRVASGVIDVGLASPNSHDWDIAAADLILSEAGGRLTDLAGAVPTYNRSHPTHGELIAVGSWLHPSLIEAMRT
ncbi:3'(2'),5'-bisphosphate nucleotidase CysQ [Microvirga sp. 2MCAF38]|uniref:3'(2'),5'-bisphosphate nucleotidase CysQ n=1 Tax=Microvirga sp. 2MCAF38 TaxID=3232989 RepID=UPI003F9BC301